MYDLCCIGHLTHDKIITPAHTIHMAGGTSFYFSHAIKQLGVQYHLVTALALADHVFTDELIAAGIGCTVLPSAHTVYFENVYSANSDERQQNVLYEATPFTTKDLAAVHAKYFHLGPLLAKDIPVELIADLSARSIVSLDVQGYLRAVANEKVIAVDWINKREALSYVSILKASETEAATLTGDSNMKTAARKLVDWGVKEVIITCGSKGSLIYDGVQFYKIPAYKPTIVKDATGCGDTYMAGYLCQRVLGADIVSAGTFGAAMASIKIADSGPFNDTEANIKKMIAANDIL